jgi:hypothetical protein
VGFEASASHGSTSPGFLKKTSMYEISETLHQTSEMCARVGCKYGGGLGSTRMIAPDCVVMFILTIHHISSPRLSRDADGCRLNPHYFWAFRVVLRLRGSGFLSSLVVLRSTSKNCRRDHRPEFSSSASLRSDAKSISIQPKTCGHCMLVFPEPFSSELLSMQGRK